MNAGSLRLSFFHFLGERGVPQYSSQMEPSGIILVMIWAAVIPLAGSTRMDHGLDMYGDGLGLRVQTGIYIPFPGATLHFLSLLILLLYPINL